MRLAWVTDPRLNFIGGRRVMRLAEAWRADSDACVITGDIAEAESVRPLLGLFARQYARPIYFVLGNHDFYGSSLKAVRRDVIATFGDSYLDGGAIHDLAPGVQLCGVDGWYDAQHGAHETSQVQLNDWFNISELSDARQRDRLIPTLRGLGQESAIKARGILAKTTAKHVISATHVPPFAESATYQGKPSSDEYLPWYTNKALGFILTEWAKQNPERELTVWCGHSHGRALFRPLPNLTVKTGADEYDAPQVELIEEL